MLKILYSLCIKSCLSIVKSALEIKLNWIKFLCWLIDLFVKSVYCCFNASSLCAAQMPHISDMLTGLAKEGGVRGRHSEKLGDKSFFNLCDKKTHHKSIALSQHWQTVNFTDRTDRFICLLKTATCIINVTDLTHVSVAWLKQILLLLTVWAAMSIWSHVLNCALVEGWGHLDDFPGKMLRVWFPC